MKQGREKKHKYLYNVSRIVSREAVAQWYGRLAEKQGSPVRVPLRQGCFSSEDPNRVVAPIVYSAQPYLHI